MFFFLFICISLESLTYPSAKTESIRLLLRTVSEDIGQRAPIRHLKLMNWNNSDSAEFQRLAGILLSHSTNLRSLNSAFSSLSTLPSSLPMFDSLYQLELANETLPCFAPLLSRLPGLQILRFLAVEASVNPPGVTPFGALPEGDPLDEFAPPMFKLRELRLSQCSLSFAQYEWLLASSTSIQFAELQELSNSAAGLISIIGASIKSLHLKGMRDVPQRGDEDLAQAVSCFTALTSLRVSGSDWPWTNLLADIRSSLTSITISYSASGCERLGQALLDHSWLRTLRSVTVDHWAGTDRFYGIKLADVNRARRSMESVCAKRGVLFIWTTDGAISDENGITMDDLA